LLHEIEAAWDLEGIKIELQPSMDKHANFTDMLILSVNGEVQGFIEVKKASMNTDIPLPSKETAQAIREAHILTLESKIESVPFALTNSIVWSFGFGVS
jgi:hypothetical protein